MFSLKKSPAIQQDRQPFVYLAAAGVLEFLFITMVAIPSYLGYYLAETYLIVPSLLFLGYVLREKTTGFARRRLLLAGLAVAWFFISQVQHKLSGMENQIITTVFSVYLLAFPFAVLTDDRENTGIRRIGKLLVAAALVLVGYTVILLLNKVPASWQEFIYWDGSRLTACWHPNITACYLMMGMGFGMALLLQAKKPLTRVLLALAVAVQFPAMALTNCRTTLLLNGALFGGIVFFRIFRGRWKQLVIGLAAAALVLVGSFKLSGMIFQWNENRILAGISAVQEEVVPSQPEATVPQEGVPNQTETAVSEEAVPNQTEAEEPYIITEDGQIVLVSDNPQGTLLNDMASLNGRTFIWKSALQAIRDNRALALWGTEYSGTVVSVYNFFPVEHSHNSWMEVLLRAGIPGLLIALVFTGISTVSAAKLLLSRETELWKKIIAMTTMCVMVTGFLEPYLFGGKSYYHVIDFVFFLCTGYLDYWSHQKQNA